MKRIIAYLVLPGADNAEIAKRQLRVTRYIERRRLGRVRFIFDPDKTTKKWRNRRLIKYVSGFLPRGSSLVFYDAPTTLASARQAIDLMAYGIKFGINIHFVKYNDVFIATGAAKSRQLLNLLYKIESDYANRRTSQTMMQRRMRMAEEAMRLDHIETEIYAYLKRGIAVNTIAKLVNTNPAVLRVWLEKQGIVGPEVGAK